MNYQDTWKYKGIFEKNKIEIKLEQISKETSKENFWKDQIKVKNVLKEKKFFEHLIETYKRFQKEIKNLKDLYTLGYEEKNDEIIHDCKLKLSDLYKDLKKLEVSCFLSGENDSLDIYLEVHAGAGGTESQAGLKCWEMYLKWLIKRNFLEIISEQSEEAELNQF